MEITKIETFLSYLGKTRLATIKVIPHDKLERAYQPDKFTISDLVRHISSSQGCTLYLLNPSGAVTHPILGLTVGQAVQLSK